MSFTVVIIILIVINVLAYVVMWIDKGLAIKKMYRIPEKYLYLLALCLGATGIFSGMCWPIYHKAAKPTFKFGIPILMLLNALAIYFMLH